MIGKKRDKTDDYSANVNITPLIDVTFLLIVFFMSIWQAAHIEVAAELSLPAASQGTPEVQKDRDRFIVNIDQDGDYYIAKTRLSKEELTRLLGREARRNLDAEGFAKRPVFIRADAGLSFGQVQDVMLICRDLHIWKLSLRARKPKEAVE